LCEIRNIITENETWWFQYDPESKQESMQWKQSTSPQHKKARVSKSQMKTMLITFFYKNGVVQIEFIPQDETVNQAYCVEILKRLHEAVSIKRPKLGPMIGFSTVTRLQLTRRCQAVSGPKNRLFKWNTHPIPAVWLRMTSECFQN
jgi:hypothetical protein